MARVQRGVRRRRRMRVLAAGGATAAVLSAAALVLVFVVRPGPIDPRPATPAAPASSAATRPLDGYEITSLPAGLRAIGPDSVYTYAVEKNRLRSDGPAPSLGEPTAAVTLRAHERGNGGSWLGISMLRPERTTAGERRRTVLVRRVPPLQEDWRQSS